MAQRRPVCRDPGDEYLVALAEQVEVAVLVSGDRDLLELERGGVVVRTPREAVEAVEYAHPWGLDFMPGRDHEARLQAQAEGHDQVIKMASLFITVALDPTAHDLLPGMVTPESLPTWSAQMSAASALLAGRGMASRPSYPTADVACVKLPPDPGVTLRATADVPLEGAIILTLQRRPELPDVAGTGGWRVHALGGYPLIEEMPGLSHPHDSTSDTDEQ